MACQVVFDGDVSPRQPTPSAPDRPSTDRQAQQHTREYAGSLHRRLLRDEVYDALLEMLLEGDVTQGQPIGIDSLASQLDVSPTPVREALAKLESTGLVQRVALKGYRVAPPLPATQMAELMDARQVIEVAAVRRTVPATKNILAQLRHAHTEHEEAGARAQTAASRHADGAGDWGTLRRYFSADWAFHRVLLMHCGNAYLLEMAESLAPHLHRLRQGGRRGPGDIEQAVAEHALVLASAETGDPEAVAAAMANHLSQVAARFERMTPA